MENEIVIHNETDLQSKIYTIRGTKVMLDSDLAEIYGYSVKAFNQQVKNNIDKFDDDFRFQLTKDEYHAILRSKVLTLENKEDEQSEVIEVAQNLKSKFLTSSWGGVRKLPYAFTEQGIYMLMTVLRGDLAVQQSYCQNRSKSLCNSNYYQGFYFSRNEKRFFVSQRQIGRS